MRRSSRPDLGPAEHVLVLRRRSRDWEPDRIPETHATPQSFCFAVCLQSTEQSGLLCSPFASEWRTQVDKQTKRLIEEIKEATRKLEAHLRGDGSSLDEWERSWKFLSDIEGRGGTVSADEFRAIGIEHGYDPRGLGGYFNGPNSAMRREPNNSRTLTDAGREYIERRRYKYGSS